MSPRIQRDLPKSIFLTRLSASALRSFSRLEGKRVAILFSGGVDSSLAAFLASRYADEIVLFTTASQGSHDEATATESARALGLKLSQSPLTAEIAWATLPKVIQAIETSNKMDVEIALPFYLAAKKAKANSFTLMVSGQGPDELFAGYARYVEVFQELGEEELEKQLSLDMSCTEEANIKRDRRAIIASGLNACFPYLYQEFIDIAMTIPGRYKINPAGTPNRKVIFREMAVMLGLPEQIAMRAKRATQYSSGSANAIAKAILNHSDMAIGRSKKEAHAMIQQELRRIGMDMGISG
ncbi:MAG: asparagine synthetase B [Candidatus Thorarchaeota archaeon]|nr:asparagine synthetase B [Candidatus Thorarchaeota archaeon]